MDEGSVEKLVVYSFQINGERSVGISFDTI